MERKELQAIAGSAVQDLASLFMLPMATATTLVRQYQERQMRKAREELFKALEAGQAGSDVPIDTDDVLSIVARYLAAARDGAARRNLQLMARTAAGLAAEGELDVDTFSRYAAGLAGLTKDQIFVAGRYVARFNEFLPVAQREYPETETDGWREASTKAHTALFEELSPTPYSTPAEVDAILASLAGVGLMSAASGFGMLVYVPTEALMRHARWTDLEAAAQLTG